MRGTKQKEMFEKGEEGRFSICLSVFPRGKKGGGGYSIFSYMPRLGLFLGVQNFEFQYFLGFSEN